MNRRGKSSVASDDEQRHPKIYPLVLEIASKYLYYVLYFGFNFFHVQLK